MSNFQRKDVRQMSIKELEDYPCPDWYKKACLQTWDTSKIKNRNDMERALHDYGEMK